MFNVKLIDDNSVVFLTQLGNSIVDDALASKVFFPHSCKIGRCQSCKFKIIDGETELLFPEQSLSDDERREGWVLGCARSAKTDLVVSDVDIRLISLPETKKMPCRISSIVKVGQNVLKVLIRLPPGHKLEFISGQYVNLVKDGIKRAYSIASSPQSDNIFEFHIAHKIDGKMSHYWYDQAQVNDLLWLHGPFGTFFMQDTKDRDLVFLTTGTGFAPIKAMIDALNHSFYDLMPKSITLYWGNRTKFDFYYDFPNYSIPINIVPVLSKKVDDWVGGFGYVQDIYLSSGPDLANASVYACGSLAMVRDAEAKLVGAGLPRHQFRCETFVCSASS